MGGGNGGGKRGFVLLKRSIIEILGTGTLTITIGSFEEFCRFCCLDPKYRADCLINLPDFWLPDSLKESK